EKIESEGLIVDKVELQDTPWGVAGAYIGVKVRNLDQLRSVMESLKRMKEVLDVERVMK
ncbi:MAG: hypothetical protein J7L34_04725, partial [Thermotogaceae bacterium]|nr:hypothetical protein [Thermotogaceae bacterium]